MRFRKLSFIPIALLLSACGSIEGVVRDGSDLQPIPDARVTLTYSNDPSGFFGQPQSEQVSTDSNGRFKIRQGGGTELAVDVPDGRMIRTTPCPLSPFDVYVGGPFAEARTDSTLVLVSSGVPEPEDLGRQERKTASNLGLTFAQTDDSDEFSYDIDAAGGVAFVRGTGAIPAPPPLPYSKYISIDLSKDCGWIFVERDNRVVAAIEARPPSSLATPEGYEEITLMFASLP